MSRSCVLVLGLLSFWWRHEGGFRPGLVVLHESPPQATCTAADSLPNIPIDELPQHASVIFGQTPPSSRLPHPAGKAAWKIDRTRRFC